MKLTSTVHAATIHNPERRNGESFADFKARRAEANALALKIAGTHLNGGVSSRKSLRDEMRKSGTMGKRVRASDALMAAWAEKRITNAVLRDAHGAYTCVGSTYEVEGMAPDAGREHVTSSWVDGDDMGYTARRKWLAGVSAQRGY